MDNATEMSYYGRNTYDASNRGTSPTDNSKGETPSISKNMKYGIGFGVLLIFTIVIAVSLYFILRDPPTVGPGKSCSNTSDCNVGLVCSSEQICAVPDGSRCSVDTECLVGSSCNADTDTCTKNPDISSVGRVPENKCTCGKRNSKCNCARRRQRRGDQLESKENPNYTRKNINNIPMDHTGNKITSRSNERNITSQDMPNKSKNFPSIVSSATREEKMLILDEIRKRNAITKGTNSPENTGNSKQVLTPVAKEYRPPVDEELKKNLAHGLEMNSPQSQVSTQGPESQAQSSNHFDTVKEQTKSDTTIDKMEILRRARETILNEKNNKNSLIVPNDTEVNNKLLSPRVADKSKIVKFIDESPGTPIDPYGLSPSIDGSEYQSSLDHSSLTPIPEITGNFSSPSHYSIAEADESGVISYIMPDLEECILDATSYDADRILILLENGSYILIGPESGVFNTYVSNIQAESIMSHKDKVYALSGGYLYVLDQINNVKSEIIWEIVMWAPNNVSHMSKTMDNRYLWIQTPEEGFLYEITSKEPNIIMKESINDYRTYGSTSDIYIDIDKRRGKGLLHNGFESDTVEVDGIFGASFTERGMIGITSKQYQEGVLNIKFINSKVYYIIRR